MVSRFFEVIFLLANLGPVLIQYLAQRWKCFGTETFQMIAKMFFPLISLLIYLIDVGTDIDVLLGVWKGGTMTGREFTNLFTTI
jgi:hypothetical protein